MSIPYNPSGRGVLAFLGFGVFFAMSTLVPGFHSRSALILAVGFVLIAALLWLRRSIWKRVLVVTDEAFIVPSGFLRLRPTRMEFDRVRECSIIQLYANLLLRIRTDDQSVEIMDVYLPDRQVLFQLRSILESSAARRSGR